MDYFAGLDISMEETSICVMDREGKIFHEAVVPTDPSSIALKLQSLKVEFELVALESGSMSHWLTDELQQKGIPAICIDARHVSAILSLNINKTDKNDARGIADAVRCKMYKEVAVKSTDDRAMCTFLNIRSTFVSQRVQIMNTIRGLLKPFGMRLGNLSKNKNCLEKLTKAASELPDIAKAAFEQLIRNLESVLASIEALNEEIKRLVKTEPLAKSLLSIPGVGPITALRFLAEIANPKRFRKSKKVGAYVGLTPKQYSSGETEKVGRISKRGPKELRTLLVEAGFVILTKTKSWSKLKAWGMKIQKKHGTKKAATALGRKLAVVMHQMALTGEAFRFTDKKVA